MNITHRTVGNWGYNVGNWGYKKSLGFWGLGVRAMHEFEHQPRLCPFQVDWGILQETCISLRDPLHGALQNYGYIYIYIYIYVDIYIYICIHIGVI